MKLSEAIRLGAMMKPQAFGRMWDDGGTTSCAMGAAYDAVGWTKAVIDLWTSAEHRARLDRTFPCVDRWVPCPHHECGLVNSIGSMIPHLNDDHHHTREEIADWVEMVEKEQEAQDVQAAQRVQTMQTADEVEVEVEVV